MDLNPLANLGEVQPENLGARPVVVLNLLKFKSPESISTYLTYVKGVLEQCSDSGAELILPYKTQTVEFEGGEWLGLLAALCVFVLLGADSAKFFAMSLE